MKKNITYIESIVAFLCKRYEKLRFQEFLEYTIRDIYLTRTIGIIELLLNLHNFDGIVPLLSD